MKLPVGASRSKPFALVGAGAAGALLLLAILWALLTPIPYLRMGIPLNGCQRCKLDELASLEADGGGECVGPPSFEARYAMDCIRASQSAHRAFWMSESLRGVDSNVAAAFVGRGDGGVERLWYDSDVAGQYRACAATVFRQRCVSPLRTNADSNLVECDVAQQREVVCTEHPR